MQYASIQYTDENLKVSMQTTVKLQANNLCSTRLFAFRENSLLTDVLFNQSHRYLVLEEVGQLYIPLEILLLVSLLLTQRHRGKFFSS